MFRIIKYIGFIVISAILLTVFLFIIFPNIFINTLLQDRIEKVFTENYPSYNLEIGDMDFDIWNNRLGSDSLIINSKDSSFRGIIKSFSVTGINWMKILVQKDFAPNVAAKSIIEAQKILLTFKNSNNEISFGNLQLSVTDSLLTVDSIKFYSLINNEQFFAKSQYRQTSFLFDINQIKIEGLDYFSIINDNIYNAKNIDIHNATIDIFVNMDKPYNSNSPNPKMPNEALSKLKEIINIDTFKIINCDLNYRERSTFSGIPGVISFNKVNIEVSNFSNNKAFSDTAIIIGEGLFMNSSSVKLFMEIPFSSPDFSMRYNGSFSRMDLKLLNSFIETSEYHRIKSGTLQSAYFNINVNSGHANGTLNVEYKELGIAVLDKVTGSEKGIFNRFSSLIGEIFIIRGNNIPDKNGQIKIGEINYSRNKDDYFQQFVWFALRNGIADVVGF